MGKKKKPLTVKELTQRAGRARMKLLTKEGRRALAVKAVTERWRKARERKGK